jgi:hypothetical protein
MARTHRFAETGARPKPHATEGVTTASMPPATQAVEDEMLIAAVPFAIGSRMSVPNPSADQFALRPTQVREITLRVLLVVVGSPLPAARLTRFVTNASGRAEQRNSGGPTCVVGDHGPLVTPRSMTPGSRHRLALAARRDSPERQCHRTRPSSRCTWLPAIGMGGASGKDGCGVASQRARIICTTLSTTVSSP